MKKSTRLIFLFLALVMLCGLSACSALPLPFSFGKKTEKTYSVPARRDADDNAFLYFGPDALLKIPDTSSAYVTGDEKNIVWLTTDGELRIAPNRKEKTDPGSGTLIAEDVRSISYVRNAGILFTTKDGMLTQYLFDGGKSSEVAKDADCFAASYDYSSVYYLRDGKIYRFFSGSSEKIGSYDPGDGDFKFTCLSDDGGWLLWSVYTDKKIDMYVYNGKETEELRFANDSEYHSGIALMNRSQDQIIAYSHYDKSVFLLSRDGEPQEIRFKDNVDLPTSYYTLFSESTGKVSEVYVQVQNGDITDLWWGNVNGDTEKLFKEVRDYGISGDKLFYLTEDEDLYETELKGARTDSGERISRDVGAIETAAEGGIVYYMKNCESTGFDGEGTLYVYRSGDRDPTKIASGVYMYYSKYSFTKHVYAWTELTLADKGSTVFYIKNFTEDEHYRIYGTLYCYKLGSDEPVKVMNDALEYIYNYEEDISSDSLYLARYESSDASYTYVSWYYYDGKEPHLIVRDSNLYS